MGSKLWKIKGHCACHLKNAASLFAYSPSERPYYYLFNSAVFPFSLSSPACTHPPTQPASQPGYEHIAGPEGSTVDNLHCVHMAEQRASEEDWHAKPNRCMIQRHKLWRVNFLYKSVLLLEQTEAWSCPRKHLHALWLFPVISQKMHFHCFMASSSKAVSKCVALFLHWDQK